MNGDLVVTLVCCLVLPALALWAVVAYARRRRQRREDAGTAAWQRHPAGFARRPPGTTRVDPVVDRQDDRIVWLLDELNRDEIRDLVPPDALARLKLHFQARLASLAGSAPAPVVWAAAAPPAAEDAPAPLVEAPGAALAPAVPEPEPVPVARTAAGALPQPDVPNRPPVVPVQAVGPDAVATAATAPRSSRVVPVPPVPAPTLAAPPEPRPRPWESWDSAVVLLYLGAFLVVAAGLVYSSYNWSDLPGWQKVGMLLGATIGFAGGGFALLRVERVRPAAETFVGIGAFLAPMNFLAAWNFLVGNQESPALGRFGTLELAALTLTVLYGIFGYRPGGLVYRYATAAAALVAVFALPPALGAGWGWGAALTALATALVPDAPRRLGGRWRRLARPAVEVGLVALPVAVGAALAAAFADGQVWTAPAALAAAALTVGRLAVRRALDPLAWLWSALVAATAGAALLAADRPPADWAPAVVALAAAWLVAGERGPRLLRRSPNRDVLHAEALALFAVAPVLAAADERWALLSLTGVVGTAGCAVLARLRRELPLVALAALAATGTYLSLGNLLPERALDAPLALLLAPGALGLALAGVVVGLRVGGRHGRFWARPVWAVAGIDALVVTLVGLEAALERGDRTADTLVLSGVAAVFGLTAIAAARSLRLPDALLAAAGWLEVAAVAALVALPAALDRTLPAVVLVSFGLAAGALLLPFGRWTAIGEGAATYQRTAAGFLAACGGLTLVMMLDLTARYVLNLGRPPTSVAHPETAWWWPYLACYLLLAGPTIAIGRSLGPAVAIAGGDLSDWAAGLATGALGLAATLGLRMIYAEVDLEAETWFAAITVVGGALAAGSLAWRSAARLPFDRALARALAVLGALFAVPALTLMLVEAGGYALDLDRRAGGDALPAWWWLYLAVFAGLVAGAHRLGRWLQEQVLAPAVAGILGAEALLLRAGFGNRWIELDGAYWLPITVTIGAMTGAAAWRLAAGGGPFDRAAARWATGVGLLVGIPPLAVMLALTAGHAVTLDEPSTVAAWGETGWWCVFLAWYAGVAALLLATGSRLARTAGLAEWATRSLSPAATVALVAVLAQGWRIVYGVLPLERLDWLALAVPLGMLVAAAGLNLRTRGLTLRRRSPDAFAARVGDHLMVVGGVLAVAAQTGGTLLTLAYVVDRGGGVPHAGDSAWWWRYLVLHLAVAAGAWGWGRSTGTVYAAPVAVGYGLLAVWLALRMATSDAAVWTVAGMLAAAGCYALWTAGRSWERGTEFERGLRRALAVGGVLLATVSLPANLVFGAVGEIAAGIEAVLYGALALGVFGAGPREREPRLTYGAAGSIAVAIAFAVAAAGVAPVNAGYAYAAFGWVLVAGSAALPAGGLLAGQRPIWERAGYAVGLLPILLGLPQDDALEPGTTAYGRLTLAVASLAGLLLLGALTAPRGRRAIQGHAAATLGLGALLMQVAAAEPANLQAYTVPVTIYVIGLAWARRHDPRVFDVLVAAGAAVLMLPPFLQSFGAGGFGWALLCGAEGLLFVFAGLGINRRVPVAAGVVAVTVVAARQTLDYVNSLPTWAIMALVGVVLLTLGTLSLIARDAFLRRVEETRQRWSALR